MSGSVSLRGSLGRRFFEEPEEFRRAFEGPRGEASARTGTEDDPRPGDVFEFAAEEQERRLAPARWRMGGVDQEPDFVGGRLLAPGTLPAG